MISINQLRLKKSWIFVGFCLAVVVMYTIEDVYSVHVHSQTGYLGLDLFQDRFINSSPSALEQPFTLIDLQDFRYLINHNICNRSKIGLLALVSTALDQEEPRHIIRSTWGSPDIPGVNTRVVFLVGTTEEPELQERIDRESSTYMDIVQGSFVDTYRNLTYKNVMGKHWASTFCPQAEFIVKTDDDMFIDMYAAYQVSREYLEDSRYKSGGFLMGPTAVGPILRYSKWEVSTDEISEEEAEKTGGMYPPAFAGAFYMTEPKTAARLVQMALSTKFFWIDDIYVTGFLAEKLGITHVDLHKNNNLNTKLGLRTKASQSTAVFLEDFIATQMERNLKLASLLQQFSRECFDKKCFNDIYFKQHNSTKDDTDTMATIQEWILN